MSITSLEQALSHVRNTGRDHYKAIGRLILELPEEFQAQVAAQLGFAAGMIAQNTPGWRLINPRVTHVKGAVVLIRRRGWNLPKGPGFLTELLLELRRFQETWGPLGGGVKGDETTLQCAMRESPEEAGMPVKIVGKIHDGEGFEPLVYGDGEIRHCHSPIYAGELDGDESQMRISAESLALHWFQMNALPAKMTPYHRSVTLCGLIPVRDWLEVY